MQTLRLVNENDDNEILNWLDNHSVSVSQGLPVRMLVARWKQAGRDQARLTASLTRLIEGAWVEPVPRAEPPHLRFTPTGFGRLTEEATNSTLVLSPFTPETGAAAPAPDAAMAKVPAASSPISAETVIGSGEVPDLFLQHGQPMTELGLRNQVLSVFRDLGLRAGTQLIAVTLTRYWQELGLRAGDLRRALDVVTRDGYLLPIRDGMDLYWQLTAAGEAWLRAPTTPVALLAAAPEVREVKAAVADDDLRLVAVHACVRHAPADGSAFEYGLVKTAWLSTGLDENALLHALDWLAKQQAVEVFVDAARRTRLRLMGNAQMLAATQPSRAAQPLIERLGGPRA